MKKVRVKLVKSGIGQPERQKRTLKALGFSKMQQTLEKTATPQIMGMLRKVEHLVTVEEI
jgi:large subunit ribosomal protein L30